jgi:DNA-nicking Smr family endonuclease
VGGIGNRHGRRSEPIKTVNLKHDLPTVQEALSRLDREIAIARQEGSALLKVVHGYGSSGTGGDIRIAVQARLHHLAEAGQIRACIFGENWSKSDAAVWRLLQAQAELKRDCDLGRANRGITVVVLLER